MTLAAPDEIMHLKPENFTPHFRNLLREDNPDWPTHEIFHWQWRISRNRNGVITGHPLYDGCRVEELDTAFPGVPSIVRMRHDIEAAVYPLTHSTTFHAP